MNRHPLALFLLALCLAETAARPAAAQDYVLSLKDNKFQPAEIEIPADRKIALTVKNLDPAVAEFESTDLNREKVVTAGGQITIYVGPLQAGRYEFFNDFHPEARGHIVVK